MDNKSTVTTAAPSKAPTISEMFQTFALAFKTKTSVFFADDKETIAAADDDSLLLLDSSEDFIPDQKVIILKPDQTFNHETQQSSQQSTIIVSEKETKIKPLNANLAHSLISSVFAAVSLFEASYLQLQTAHVPFEEAGIKAADEFLVSHLRRFSDFKQLYLSLCGNPAFGAELGIGSYLEAQVQENQSKLRVLGTISDRLQEEIDRKDNEVLELRKNLGDTRRLNSKFSKRLSGNSNLGSSRDILLSARVFDSLLNDAWRATRKFTKILIDLMRKARWDLNLAANSVHADIQYAKTGHNCYAFLSYACIGMFRGFNFKDFSLGESDAEILCDGHISGSMKTSSLLKQLLEHVSSSPAELISKNPNCEFSKFCEKKYQELVHPTMESSVFSKLNHKGVVLDSWKSLSLFYESFVNMASAVWTLHKLAYSFDPVVENFQVERGVDFSMIHMEDVTRRTVFPAKTRAKVGFTVVPGFKIGRTVIQSQVYLSRQSFVVDTVGNFAA